jgi:hypothetical protein
VSATEALPDAVDADIGPIDIVVIGFQPDAPMTGDAIPLLLDLVERGVVRVLDVLFVTKDEDGTFSGFNATDLTPDTMGDLAMFEGASSGMLGDEDASIAAEDLEPGTAAVIIVYENRWAAPFAAAVRRNGGRLLATARIPVQDVIASLDEAEKEG